jgi:hypothetical protein
LPSHVSSSSASLESLVLDVAPVFNEARCGHRSLVTEQKSKAT